MEEENTILMDINLVLAGVYNYLEKALKDMKLLKLVSKIKC